MFALRRRISRLAILSLAVLCASPTYVSAAETAQAKVIAADSDILNCVDESGVDWVCAAIDSLGIYVRHAQAINHGLAVMIAPLTRFASPAKVSQDMSSIVEATPYVSVLGNQSPCSGGDTIEIQYHIDGSRDCVEPTSAHVMQSESVDVLIVETVDDQHHTNNALVYQFDTATPTNSRFLGTVFENDQNNVKIDYTNPGYISLSFENASGSSKNCSGSIVLGRWLTRC